VHLYYALLNMKMLYNLLCRIIYKHYKMRLNKLYLVGTLKSIRIY